MISLPDWLTGYDSENAARAEAADAKLRELNAKRAADGFYTTEQFKGIQERFNAQEPFTISGQRAAIADDFKSGLGDGRKNISGFVSDTFNTIGNTLGSVVLGVPAWVWLAGGLAIWFYLGAPGARKLKGKFA